jgi:tetratricopeptide (TPR) repeat protein
MKKGFGIVFIVFVGLIYSCGNDSGNQKTKEEIESSIKEMEDSLNQMQVNVNQNTQIPSLAHQELINRLLTYYHNFPEDQKSAEYLDKIHMKYSGLNMHEKAVKYADTLLEKYPKYINRAMVLESQGFSYDAFITPRNPEKVRYYYELLLKENPKMNKEKFDGLQERLKHLDMTFDEYCDFQISAISVK